MRLKPVGLLWRLLSLFMSFVIAKCQIDPYDAPYANIRPNDCAPEITRTHQRFLFTSYRALYDYRKYHHDYNRLEEFEGDHRQTPKDWKDVLDRPENDGSVVFYNWEDKVPETRL